LEQSDDLQESAVGLVANTLAETKDLAFTDADEGVFDEAEEFDAEPDQITYDITSYGADLPADMLVSRLQKKDIVIPQFQREFVWTLRDASRFIESLILGLPVPGVFFSRDKESRLVVVDGQQRLRSLLAFFENDFKGKSFALAKVHEMLEGRRYKELEPEQRRMLDNSLIHATIFTQNSPQDGDSATYSIFERLNTGGRRLYPQEIRAAVHYAGGFSELLKSLNNNESWRQIYGKRKSDRMKDVELVLRFCALLMSSDAYEKPMKTFLNDFMAANAALTNEKGEELRIRFEAAIAYICGALGSRAFKPLTAFNAAVFDAVMVGVSRRLSNGAEAPSVEGFVSAYNSLLAHEDFKAAYSRATSDKDSVETRLRMATESFANL
jgi:hypothetical protein